MAQAERGHVAYERACAGCHGGDLRGDEPMEVPALVAERFTAQWGGGPISDLFDKISRAMPADKPGTLSRTEYADIVAYILERNRYPAGPTELPSDSAALKSYILERLDGAR
jgi:mono/diheme cytochrome c family protein